MKHNIKQVLNEIISEKNLNKLKEIVWEKYGDKQEYIEREDDFKIDFVLNEFDIVMNFSGEIAVHSKMDIWNTSFIYVENYNYSYDEELGGDGVPFFEFPIKDFIRNNGYSNADYAVEHAMCFTYESFIKKVAKNYFNIKDIKFKYEFHYT